MHGEVAVELVLRTSQRLGKGRERGLVEGRWIGRRRGKVWRKVVDERVTEYGTWMRFYA